jgi:hypothetical protein
LGRRRGKGGIDGCFSVGGVYLTVDRFSACQHGGDRRITDDVDSYAQGNKAQKRQNTGISRHNKPPRSISSRGIGIRIKNDPSRKKNTGMDQTKGETVKIPDKP